MLSGRDGLLHALAPRLRRTEEPRRQHATAQCLLQAAVLQIERNMGRLGLDHLVRTDVRMRHPLDVLEQPVHA